MLLPVGRVNPGVGWPALRPNIERPASNRAKRSVGLNKRPSTLATRIDLLCVTHVTVAWLRRSTFEAFNPKMGLVRPVSARIDSAEIP